MALKTHGQGMLAEINVTPFVDVMLVLLIIFMVTAPMMTQGVEVDLPQTKTVRSLPHDDEHLVLSIKNDGEIFIDEYKVSFDELESHLVNLVKNQHKMLFLRADKNVPYGDVVKVMGEIKSAGIDKLGIVAEPDDKPSRKGK